MVTPPPVGNEDGKMDKGQRSSGLYLTSVTPFKPYNDQ